MTAELLVLGMAVLLASGAVGFVSVTLSGRRRLSGEARISRAAAEADWRMYRLTARAFEAMIDEAR